MDLSTIDWEKLSLGLLALITGLLGALGYNRSKGKGGEAGAQVEIRGALVTDEAVTRFVRAMDRNTAALEDKAAALRENTTQILLMTQALGRNSTVCDDLREQLPGLGGALHTLAIETARGKRD